MFIRRDDLSDRLIVMDESWGTRNSLKMDVLTNVLETTQVRGVILSDFRHRAPWGISFEEKNIAGFHLVTEGECWLRVDRRKPIRILQGDLVLLPNGVAHALSDAPDSPVIPLAQLVAGRVGSRSRTPLASLRGTRMVCGAFRSEGGLNPLLALLPTVLHLDAAQLQRCDSLRSTLRLLLAELDRRSPGADALIDRLVDTLFIYVIRTWVEAQPEGKGGWLGALRDEQIGRALASVHQTPARRWTVKSLASTAGLSRAAFGRKFTLLVGEPPLAYLTRWRMELALRSIRTTSQTLAHIAADVGYDSEFAFSRAFKRTLGSPPSSFREAHVAL